MAAMELKTCLGLNCYLMAERKEHQWVCRSTRLQLSVERSPFYEKVTMNTINPTVKVAAHPF
jgi:hypothetical protein